MIVDYKNNKIKKICTNYTAAVKEYGTDNADKITERIDQISSASSVNELIQFGIGRCHPLEGNRKKEYAMDLVHPHRLVFSVDSSNKNQIAIIIEVIDYH